MENTEQTQEQLSALLQVRRDKLTELQNDGRDPFKITKFERTHTSAQLKENYTEEDRELKKRGVKKLKVVYSEEIPTRPIEDMAISCRTNCICPPGAEHKCTERRDIPGSVAFVPSVAGLIIAGEVVKDLIRK